MGREEKLEFERWFAWLADWLLLARLLGKEYGREENWGWPPEETGLALPLLQGSGLALKIPGRCCKDLRVASAQHLSWHPPTPLEMLLLLLCLCLPLLLVFQRSLSDLASSAPFGFVDTLGRLQLCEEPACCSLPPVRFQSFIRRWSSEQFKANFKAQHDGKASFPCFK